MAIKTRKKYTSKGSGVSVNKKTLNGMKRDREPGINDVMNKIDAWRSGKNPWLTVENPNKNETNKRFIRVKANDYWGFWKDKQGYMFNPREAGEG